jgi:hypothetical protein
MSDAVANEAIAVLRHGLPPVGPLSVDPGRRLPVAVWDGGRIGEVVFLSRQLARGYGLETVSLRQDPERGWNAYGHGWWSGWGLGGLPPVVSTWSGPCVCRLASRARAATRANSGRWRACAAPRSQWSRPPMPPARISTPCIVTVHSSSWWVGDPLGSSDSWPRLVQRRLGRVDSCANSMSAGWAISPSVPTGSAVPAVGDCHLVERRPGNRKPRPRPHSGQQVPIIPSRAVGTAGGSPTDSEIFDDRAFGCWAPSVRWRRPD